MSFTLPTEMVDLPSKGLLYPESNPLSSGQVEIKYMTAKEEDILTNQNYISNGTVLDRLLKSLIVSEMLGFVSNSFALTFITSFDVVGFTLYALLYASAPLPQST